MIADSRAGHGAKTVCIEVCHCMHAFDTIDFERCRGVDGENLGMRMVGADNHGIKLVVSIEVGGIARTPG